MTVITRWWPLLVLTLIGFTVVTWSAVRTRRKARRIERAFAARQRRTP